MTADIKIGGTKNKKWRNNEEKKKSTTRSSLDALLSAQLALSMTKDAGAKQRRYARDSAPALSGQQVLSGQNRN